MRRYYYANNFMLFFFAALFFIASCNTGNTDKKTDVKPVIDSSTTTANTQAQQPKTDLISGSLDVLWTKGQTFLDLPNGTLIFSFIFTSADKLTIHGWRDKIIGGIDPKTPVLELENGKASGYNYGPNMYFGDLILENGDINKIQRMIKDPKNQYVYFSPEISETKYIKYRIFIGTEDPNKFVKDNATNTDTYANPSPPKTY